MKFTCSVEIDAPFDVVVEVWQNPSYYEKWQDGFESIELISGNGRQPGTRSKITYRENGKEMILVEDILQNDLPSSFTGLYLHKHMENTMTSVFQKISENKSRYSATVEYTKFHHFVPKLMAFLTPGVFKKQVQKWQDQFKEYIENEHDFKS